MRLPLATFLCMSVLAGCGTAYRDTSRPIQSVTEFDVTAYLGTWYEIARFPVVFQRGCTATTAEYGALDATSITVLNTCREGSPDGPIRQIEGKAEVVGPGKLSVQFDTVPFIRAPYWVLWVDEAYATAVVGVPNGRAGWILAREPQISAMTRAKAEDILRRNGYDPAALITVPH